MNVNEQVNSIKEIIDAQWEKSPRAYTELDAKINEIVIQKVIKHYEEMGCKVSYMPTFLNVELPPAHPLAMAFFKKEADKIINKINAILGENPLDEVGYEVSTVVHLESIDLAVKHYQNIGLKARFDPSVQYGMRDWSPAYIYVKMPK